MQRQNLAAAAPPIPLLREVTTTTTTTSTTTTPPPPPPSPPIEGVVYGNWQPEQVPKQRVFGRLEAMLMGLPATEAEAEQPQLSTEQLDGQPGNQHSYAADDASLEQSTELRGRWRAAMPNLPSELQPQAALEEVRLNATDALLRAMATQLSESMETTTGLKQQTLAQTAEDNWMPITYTYSTAQTQTRMQTQTALPTKAPTMPTLPVESSTISLSWPTDFVAAGSSSTERASSIDRIDNDVIDTAEDYKYYQDTLNSAQMHSELSVPESVVPQRSLNITKVGVPYEDRNSAEEPTICVPLTVMETATESDTPVLVELERIYCFPLPKVEIRTVQLKETPVYEEEQPPISSSESSPETTTALPTAAPKASATLPQCRWLLLWLLPLLSWKL
ncbi:CG13157 [Drosophila busckii]|uniref:CG13157 n=2 Tax=Drosophila busckii TaxID=30019 RepID=A0A0M3QV10_DROBS|nr:CG13157 [Drosophila busckii]